tara:strand:+ start:1661 stop:2812 length:1152 start_codon:yes stop_codon:yes gene_type:complete
MTNEIHLVIIWSEAGNKKDKILNDLSSKFEILKQYIIGWNTADFSDNLSRFYGENLPKNSDKEKHCGIGSFYCIIVKDKNPIYDYRNTSKGNRVVNVNLFDSKQRYRSWTGGGHKIHASDNINESKLQIALLLGGKYSNYLKLGSNNNGLVVYNNNIQGNEGWDSFSHLFSVLNECLTYVVLRNFDNLNEELDALHPDVDLLVDDKDIAINILKAKKIHSGKNRVQYSVKISGKDINFDLRSVSDNYYNEKWQREILLNKRSFKGVFIPSKQDHFYSLLYHAIIHKRGLTIDYIDKLIELSNDIQLNLSKKDFLDKEPLKILVNHMDITNNVIVVPNDLSVYFNYEILKKSFNIRLTLARKTRIFYLHLRVKLRQILNKFKKG